MSRPGVDELNREVSDAIRAAEVLDDGIGPLGAKQMAWLEVSRLERLLAELLSVTVEEGKIARRGAVLATLKGGDRAQAEGLAEVYSGEEGAPAEFQAGIRLILDQEAPARQGESTVGKGGHRSDVPLPHATADRQQSAMDVAAQTLLSACWRKPLNDASIQLDLLNDLWVDASEAIRGYIDGDFGIERLQAALQPKANALVARKRRERKHIPLDGLLGSLTASVKSSSRREIDERDVASWLVGLVGDAVDYLRVSHPVHAEQWRNFFEAYAGRLPSRRARNNLRDAMLHIAKSQLDPSPDEWQLNAAGKLAAFLESPRGTVPFARSVRKLRDLTR